MLSRRAGVLKLDRLDVGMRAGVVLPDVTLDMLGLTGVAGGGLGQVEVSDVSDLGLVLSGDRWSLCAS